LPFASLKRFFKNGINRLFWFLINNISYFIGTCFQRLFTDRFCPSIKESFNKTEDPPEEEPYSVTPLHPETSTAKEDKSHHHHFRLRSTVYIDPL